MMQLKHLLHDRTRAIAIVSRWEHDPAGPDFMERFRISANAVYPYSFQGERRFLRFAPADETSAAKLEAELEFLTYLRACGYPANRALPSKAGSVLECVDHAGVRYFAVSFLGVPGTQLDPETMSLEEFAGWGAALGRLHRLSAGYRPRGAKRDSWLERLAWANAVLAGFPDQAPARREVELVSSALGRLPDGEGTYGLIHYDFEADNVFYDPATGAYSIIDFDDAVYHWYAMDVTAAISCAGELTAPQRQGFFSGYAGEMPLDERVDSQRALFERYAGIYGYARVWRSLHGGPPGPEPDWMVGLRQRLREGAEEQSRQFGQPL